MVASGLVKPGPLPDAAHPGREVFDPRDRSGVRDGLTLLRTRTRAISGTYRPCGQHRHRSPDGRRRTNEQATAR